MKKLLGMDSPIIKAAGSIVDCILYSILWLICSLPIITLGASTEALCWVTVSKCCQEDESAGAFFRAFRESFVSSIISWFLLAVGFAACGFGLPFWVLFWLGIILQRITKRFYKQMQDYQMETVPSRKSDSLQKLENS